MPEQTVTNLFANECRLPQQLALEKVLDRSKLPWVRCGCGCQTLKMRLGNTLVFTLYFKRGQGFSLYSGHVEGEKCILEYTLYEKVEVYVFQYAMRQLLDEVESSHQGLAFLIRARPDLWE